MMTNGIYTLANDAVYDQLVALLNSIEVNIGSQIPVCVIPYNDQLDRVKQEIATRKNVFLFEDQSEIDYWLDFGIQVLKSHPKALNKFKVTWGDMFNHPSFIGFHRKFCALFGSFEKFIYFDADTLAMSRLNWIYDKLEEYDWVSYDFQYQSDLSYVYDTSSGKFNELFDTNTIKSHIFCGGWFASKKGVFTRKSLDNLLDKLTTGEAEVMQARSLFWTEQALFNYLVTRSKIRFLNIPYHHRNEATGTLWLSNYEIVNNILYDKGRPLPYLHYMGISSSKFARLCKGEDIDIPYRDLFLYYRYLKSPEEQPQLKSPNFWVRNSRNISQFIELLFNRIKIKLRTLKYRLLEK